MPTVNVGIRQSGRIKAKSILSCNGNSVNIVKAIEVFQNNFLKKQKNVIILIFKKIQLFLLLIK